MGGEKTETGKGVITMDEQCIVLFIAVIGGGAERSWAGRNLKQEKG